MEERSEEEEEEEGRGDTGVSFPKVPGPNPEKSPGSSGLLLHPDLKLRVKLKEKRAEPSRTGRTEPDRENRPSRAGGEPGGGKWDEKARAAGKKEQDEMMKKEQRRSEGGGGGAPPSLPGSLWLRCPGGELLLPGSTLRGS